MREYTVFFLYDHANWHCIDARLVTTWQNCVQCFNFIYMLTM